MPSPNGRRGGPGGPLRVEAHPVPGPTAGAGRHGPGGVRAGGRRLLAPAGRAPTPRRGRGAPRTAPRSARVTTEGAAVPESTGTDRQAGGGRRPIPGTSTRTTDPARWPPSPSVVRWGPWPVTGWSGPSWPTPPAFPWATLRRQRRRLVRAGRGGDPGDRTVAAATASSDPLVAVGFCGGFTTFSTFAVEVDQRVRHGHVGTAAAYLVASLLAGVGAALAGITLARGRMLPAVGRPGPVDPDLLAGDDPEEQRATGGGMILLGLVVAGACGALLRYEVELHVRRRLGPAFPCGTLLINVSGAFAPRPADRAGRPRRRPLRRGDGGRHRPARRLHHVLHIHLRHRGPGRAGPAGRAAPWPTSVGEPRARPRSAAAPGPAVRPRRS